MKEERGKKQNRRSIREVRGRWIVRKEGEGAEQPEKQGAKGRQRGVPK